MANHYYGRFTPTTHGYHASDGGTTLVAYSGNDAVVLALIEGVEALTVQNVEVVVESLPDLSGVARPARR